MADTTLRLRYPTGATLYTQIENGPGVWNGTAYVTFVLASWGTYATATPETPASSGRYVCQFPTSSPAGNYSWTTYLRAGGSPASTDTPVGAGGGYWDGTAFGPPTGTVTLPSPAPAGYGPIGTGSVTVTQDYPTTGNLTYRVTSTGPGIGGAYVRAFLKSEYDFDPNAAATRGQTVTLASGAWANSMLLDPGAYYVVFAATGYEPLVVPLTVS